MMSRIKGANTRPERLVRSYLHGLGLRFRLHEKNLPGKPDLVFAKYRAVVFVHGCFWHRHGCRKTYMPKTRPEFWAGKFEGNVRRDARAIQQLREMGWRVFVVWECEAGIPEHLDELAVLIRGTPNAKK